MTSILFVIRDGSDEDPDYRPPRTYEIVSPDGQELDLTFGPGAAEGDTIDDDEGDTRHKIDTGDSMDRGDAKKEQQKFSGDEANVTGKQEQQKFNGDQANVTEEEEEDFNNTTAEDQEKAELKTVLDTVKSHNAHHGIVSR